MKPSVRKGVVSTFMEKVKRTGVKMIPLDLGPLEALNEFQKTYTDIFKR